MPSRPTGAKEIGIAFVAGKGGSEAEKASRERILYIISRQWVERQLPNGCEVFLVPESDLLRGENGMYFDKGGDDHRIASWLPLRIG
jgi:hypothetical protein